MQPHQHEKQQRLYVVEVWFCYFMLWYVSEISCNEPACKIVTTSEIKKQNSKLTVAQTELFL